MKKIIFAVIGFFVWQTALAQSSVDASVLKTRNAVTIVNRTYTNSTSDTTFWLNSLAYKKIWLNIQSKDSARLVIAYRVSFDTTTAPAFTTYDSLITTDNGGGSKTTDYTSILGGFPFIQWRFATSGAAGSGTTSNTYTAGYKREK